MFRFLCDHDLNDAIASQLEEKTSNVDVVRARDQGLSRTDDRVLLAWAAENDRIILSHDRNTMAGFAYDRLRRGEAMRGLFVIAQTRDIGRVVSDLLDVVELTDAHEWANRVEFFPW